MVAKPKSVKNIPDALWRRMKAFAALQGTNISDVIAEALSEYLEKHNA